MKCRAARRVAGVLVSLVLLGWVVTWSDAAASDLSYRTHFLGHAGSEPPPQESATCLAVTADGTCVVGSRGWPDKPPTVVMYRDGAVVGRCDPLPDPAFTGGTAVAVSEQFIFLAVDLTPATPEASQDPSSSHPPAGSVWHGVWRWTRDGRPAPFAGGRGPGGAYAVIQTTMPSTTDQSSQPVAIPGLWVHDGELFLSDAAAGRVRVFDESSMQEIRVFRVAQPGPLCVLTGRLHVVERDRAVATYSLDGRATGQVLDEGEDFLPGALAPAPDGRLAISDRGLSQQIHLFNMSGVPTRVRTLGDENGLSALTSPGEVGPRRFAGLTGVGTDAAGNYFLTMEPPPGGGILRSFGPDRVTLRWQWQAVTISHGVDADPLSHGLDVFATEGRHALDLRKPPGQSWRWVAQSVDPFRVPHDPRLVPSRGGTTTFRQWPHGKFLFHRSAEGMALVCFRLQTHRATPVFAMVAGPDAPPALRLPHQPGRGPWVWSDHDANGQPSAAEFSPLPPIAARFPASPVDAHGGLWQIADNGTLHHWPLQGVSAAGVPQYDHAPTLSRPPPSGLRPPLELHYDPSTDVLLLSSLSQAPESTTPTATLHKIDQWSHPSGPTPHWQITLPITPGNALAPSLATAGSLVFTLDPLNAHVHVLSTTTEPRLLGALQPPTTTTPTTTTTALRAHYRPDGTYLVFTQHPAALHAIAYHLDPPR